MPLTRFFAAAAVIALTGALAAPAALAQTASTAKTEAAARAATGKPSSDAPANTRVQGTAAAVRQAAPSATASATNVQAEAAAAPATLAKPVTPNGTLLDTLKLDGRFTTFVGAVTATNLGEVLKMPQVTVFAPTDDAFKAMPPAELQRLNGDKMALRQVILHHIINAPVPAAKIKGTKGEWPTGAQDKVLLDGGGDTLKADGATIVQADVKPATGTLHVVDKVLIAGQGDRTMPEAAATTGQAAPTAAAPAAPAEGTKAKPKP